MPQGRTWWPAASKSERELTPGYARITRTESRVSFRSIPWAAHPARTHDATAATCCAPSTARYERRRIALGGDTVRLVRDIPALPVSAAERDSAIAELEARGPTGLDFSRIPSTKLAIHRLTVDIRTAAR